MTNLIIEAFELKRKGYYKQAIELYYKQLSKNDTDIEILVELADLYYLLENFDRANHYINQALDLNKEHIGALTVLKKVYLSEENYKKAEETAKKIYELTTNENDLTELLNIYNFEKKYEAMIEYTNEILDTDGVYLVAYALYNTDRYDDAINFILQKEDLYSDINENKKLLELLGKIYSQTKNMEKAREVFKKLENLTSNDAETLNLMGLDKIKELKPDEALEYFNKALEQDKNKAEYHYNMGQAYYLKGWFDEAKRCFNTAICLDPMNESYHYSLAYLLYRCGEYENAQSHLNPEYVDSKILLQVINIEKGNLAKAKVELEKLLAEDDKNELVLFSLTRIYFNLDMLKQAKTTMEKLLEVNSDNFEYQIFYVRTLIKLGLYEDAKLKIEELLNKYPKYYYAKVLEAELYNETKNYDDLFDTAQELIELDMNKYEGYYYNALALFEKDDINFAIESMKKAISQDVNNAELYVKMSEFYQAIGKIEDAFEYIKEASDIDKSAKNQELYFELAKVLQRKGLSRD